MSKHSLRYLEIYKTINKKNNNLSEAISFLQNLPPLKLKKNNLELQISLNLKKKEIKQYIFNLPNPIYNSKKICVLLTYIELQYYKQISFEIIGSNELFWQIFIGNLTFDVIFTTLNFYPQLNRIIRRLGSTKIFVCSTIKTLISDINNFQQGTMLIKSDKTNVLHIIVGKLSYLKNKLIENIKNIFLTIYKDCPHKYSKLIKSISLCTEMSPSLSLKKQNNIFQFDNQ